MPAGMQCFFQEGSSLLIFYLCWVQKCCLQSVLPEKCNKEREYGTGSIQGKREEKLSASCLAVHLSPFMGTGKLERVPFLHYSWI